MTHSGRGDVIYKTWLFCPATGDIMGWDDPHGVLRSGRLPSITRPLAPLDDTMSVTSAPIMSDYQRRYELEPLVKSKEQLQFEEILRSRVRATVAEPCPRCKAPEMEYHTMQLRSADEGQVHGAAGEQGIRRESAWAGRLRS